MPLSSRNSEKSEVGTQITQHICTCFHTRQTQNGSWKRVNCSSAEIMPKPLNRIQGWFVRVTVVLKQLLRYLHLNTENWKRDRSESAQRQIPWMVVLQQAGRLFHSIGLPSTPKKTTRNSLPLTGWKSVTRYFSNVPQGMHPMGAAHQLKVSQGRVQREGVRWPVMTFRSSAFGENLQTSESSIKELNIEVTTMETTALLSFFFWHGKRGTTLPPSIC